MPRQREVPDIVIKDGKPVGVILRIEHYRDLLTRLGDKDGLDSLKKALSQAEHAYPSEWPESTRLQDCGF